MDDRSAPAGQFESACFAAAEVSGAAPIQWAIACGESVTGVTTMRIDAGLDTGDILLQREMSIGRKIRRDVGPKLASIGAI